jgi:hypothetical protein
MSMRHSCSRHGRRASFLHIHVWVADLGLTVLTGLCAESQACPLPISAPPRLVLAEPCLIMAAGRCKEVGPPLGSQSCGRCQGQDSVLCRRGQGGRTLETLTSGSTESSSLLLLLRHLCGAPGSHGALEASLGPLGAHLAEFSLYEPRILTSNRSNCATHRC